MNAPNLNTRMPIAVSQTIEVVERDRSRRAGRIGPRVWSDRETPMAALIAVTSGRGGCGDGRPANRA
jgi:hypothetical protein